MAFNALVNLGTVGEDITGSTVSISGCTGASCGSGCTSLVTGQSVSSFPKTLSGITDTVVSLYVKVDNGQCSGTTQCISINFVSGPTATPTNTPTPTPTATPVGPTATPTSTPTSTPTPTPIVPTPTPTPTDTPVSCVDSVSFDVDSAGEIRYVTCEGVTVYETYGIGPQVINDCIENNSLFALSATISFVSYGSPCVVPTPTPIPPTPTTPALYGFFRSNPSNLCDGHCNNNQLTSAQFYSTSSTIPFMLSTIVYDSNQDPWVGGDSYYAVSSDNTFNTNNPPYYVIRVDDFGLVTEVQYVASDCNCDVN